MSNRDNRVVTYLTDSEKSQLNEWADETDKSVSHLLREAVLEYTDKDRTARIEEKVDRALTILESGEHTHTQDMPGGSQSVPEKARAIAKRCYENHSMPMQGQDLKIAIEDIAGADDRTIEKYKDQLKKRGLMYTHPLQPVWTDSKRKWVKWVEGATVDKDVHEWTDEYKMKTDEYRKIVDEIQQ